MAALASFIESFPALWGETALRATLFLTGTFVLALVLSRATAGARHALWTGATLGLLALPFLTGGLPSFTVPVALPGLAAPAPETAWPESGKLPASSGIASVELHMAQHPQEEGTAAPQRAGVVLLQQASREAGAETVHASGAGWVGAGTDAVGSPGADASQAGPSRTGASGASGSVATSPRSSLLPVLLLAIWLGGVLGVGIPLIVGLRGARRLVRETREIRDPEWGALLDRVRGRVGLRREVSLRVGRAIRTPLAGGVLRPVILLPESARDWSAERREIVLTHEAIHLRRADPLAQIVGRVVVALYWFHPLAWIMVANARRAREEACDEAVVSLGHRPSNYARHLIDLAPVGGRPDPVLSGIHGPHLEKRIMSILRASPESRSPVLRRTAAVTAVAAVVVWSVACAAAVSSDGPGGWDRAGTLPPAPTPLAPPYPPAGLFAPMALPETEVVIEYPTPPPAQAAPRPGVARTAPPAPPAPPGRIRQLTARLTPGAATAPGVLLFRAPSVASDGTRPAMPTTAPPAGARLALVPPGPPRAVTQLAPTPMGLMPALTPEGFAASCDPIRVAPPEGREDRSRVMVRIVADGIALCRMSEGEIRWSDDRRAITGMAEGAWMVIEAVEGDVRQRVEIEGIGGEPAFHWFVEGEARAFDGDAGEWLDAALELLAGRAMGIGEGVRVYRFREGPGGDRAEVRSLQGDSVRSVVRLQEMADMLQRFEVERLRTQERRSETGPGTFEIEVRARADSARIQAHRGSDRVIELELRALGDTTRAVALRRSDLAIEALAARGDPEAYEAASARFREIFERVRRD